MDNNDPIKRLLQELAPAAPGFLLAPTQFGLAGEPEDFVEWVDWEGIPLGCDVISQEADDEGGAWTVDPSCWLLVFRGCKEQPGNLVCLDKEIYIDSAGQHYLVDLEKHWGKNHRPASAKPLDSVQQAWGWRFPDSYKSPYELFPIWIWASPFQLDWERLPPMKADDHTCLPGKFGSWAAARGIEHNISTLEDLRVRPNVTVVRSVWQEAFALNRKFYDTLLGTQLGPTERNRRFLYSTVRGLIDDNPILLRHLNERKFFGYDKKISAQDMANQQRVSESLAKLMAFLKSSRFQSFLKDFDYTHDQWAWRKKLIVLSRAYRQTENAPAAVEHLREASVWIKKDLSKHYDLVQGSKDFRKTAKSYLYLAKAFLEPADFKKGVPQWLEEPFVKFAKYWYDLPLRVVNRPLNEDPNTIVRVWNGNDAAEIRKHSSLSPIHLRFFLLLEAVNVGYQAVDLLKAKDNKFKKSLGLVSALASLTAQTIDVLRTTAGMTSAEQSKIAKNVANKMVEIGPVRDKYRTFIKGPFMKHAALKGSINMVGSAAEMVSGSMTAYEDWITDDRKAAAYHGVQALGGFVSLAGYTLVATGLGAPLGAVLVFVGSAAGLTGSVGGALAKTTDLEKWLMFCEWGGKADADGEGEHEQTWAGGRPLDLCRMVGRQIRTLNEIVIGLKVDATVVFDDLQRPCAEVAVTINMLAKEGSVYLEVDIDGEQKRAFSPWKHGEDARASDGMFRERFRFDKGASWVFVRVHAKPFGNDVWYPAKAIEKSFPLTGSWLHGPAKEGESA
jgi:hypothetical protein